MLLQAGFLQTGSGAVLRTGESKLRDVVSVKDYGAVCDGVTNDSAAFTSAIASLPATGGLIDARSCLSGIALTSLSVTKSGVTIQWPAARISLGANPLTVPVGNHSVAFMCTSPYGSPITATATGTYFTFTGTGAAIIVGDSTGDTLGFMLQDCTVQIAGAGTAAIGIQLNRAINYTLTRPRVQGLTSANTQLLIDLEGFTNFTGGLITAPYLSNGNNGIYFGKNANANTVTAAEIALPATGTGIGYNIAGSASGSATGNAILGGDVENCLYMIQFDFAASTMGFGLRSEACSKLVNATANSVTNMTWSNGATPNTQTDLGTSNSFMTTFTHIFAPTLWKMRNQTDAQSDLVLQAGLTTGQQININYWKWDGTNQWQVQKDSAENFQILHVPSSLPRLAFAAASNTTINSEGTGGVNINPSTNAGTGGVNFYSGGAVPTVSASVDTRGFGTFNDGLIVAAPFTNAHAGGNFTGGATSPGVIATAGGAPVTGALRLTPQAAPSTPANGDTWIETTSNVAKMRINAATVQVSPTKGTVTMVAGTGTATVLASANCVCTDTTANASVKCAVAVTTLTMTGTGTDVIQYLCF